MQVKLKIPGKNRKLPDSKFSRVLSKLDIVGEYIALLLFVMSEDFNRKA